MIRALENLKLEFGKLGDMSCRILKLGELGAVSFRLLKLGGANFKMFSIKIG